MPERGDSFSYVVQRLLDLGSSHQHAGLLGALLLYTLLSFVVIDNAAGEWPGVNARSLARQAETICREGKEGSSSSSSSSSRRVVIHVAVAVTVCVVVGEAIIAKNVGA